MMKYLKNLFLPVLACLFGLSGCAQLHTVHGFDHNYTQDTPAADKIVADFLADQLL